MAEDADLAEAAAPEEADAFRRIGGEIGGRRGGIIAGGSRRAAVVVAERRDAGPGEGVGDDGEGFMTHQLFVPVLGTAAANKQ